MDLLINVLLAVKVLGIKVINEKDFFELVVRFFFNLFVSTIIARFIYYPITRRRSYLFTYLLFSIIVFLLTHLLSNVKMELGFALGLFALFGIIRYRTNSIPIKEMTYLFVIIGIAAINGLANKKVSHVELLFTNFVVIAVTYGLEKLWLNRPRIVQKNILYEKIDLIKPAKRTELISDLKERTGLDVLRVEIRQIDFLRDVARIAIFYYDSTEEEYIGEEDGNNSSIDQDD